MTALAALLSCGDDERGRAQRAPTPLDAATTGTITGTVLFDGAVPTMPTLPVGAGVRLAAPGAGVERGTRWYATAGCRTRSCT